MAQPKLGAQPRQEGDRKYGVASVEPPVRFPSHGATTGGAGNRRESSRVLLSSAQNFGIDESNLETRRKFIRLGEEDRSVLAGLLSWTRSMAPQIAKEFYDWQFEFGPTRRFFETYAQGAGMSIRQLRQALERAQTRYFAQIFEGVGKTGAWTILCGGSRLAQSTTRSTFPSGGTSAPTSSASD